MARGLPIRWKLLGATLLPTVLTFGAFGLIAHATARRALEEELGRRLSTVAQAAALAVRAERPDLLAPGDEESRTYRNVRRKLAELRDASGVRRLYVLDAERRSRADTDEGVPIGARYFTQDGNAVEVARALRGEPVSSVLFTGRDGALYKTGFAPLPDEAGAIVGVIAGDGAAPIYEQLAAFRRALFLFGGAGALAVVLLSIVVARLITRPVEQLEAAARRIGEGDLDTAVARRSTDEIGFLAETLETMRRQLRARDERLQMMLAGIAHEVRNPLAGMELFAGLLREDLEGDEAKLAQVRRIERELAHLKTIVSEFLDYARRPRLELVAVDAAEIVSEVHQMIAAEAGARVRVGIEAPAPSPMRADAAQLRRALLNLGKNALQALGEAGGEIVLGCEAGAREVRLSVRDTGPGVPEEAREKLFQPFFTTREKGTGLGLAFVAEIARDHGGRVEVESEAGRGARFVIVIPRGATTGD